MRVQLYASEEYPFYIVDHQTDPDVASVEVPDEIIDRYEVITNEWRELQEVLRQYEKKQEADHKASKRAQIEQKINELQDELKHL